MSKKKNIEKKSVNLLPAFFRTEKNSKFLSSTVDEIPTLSKTTVYNTLNLFIEKQIAVVIVIEENETRYDVEMNFHGHFKCEKCGKVSDVDIDPEVINFDSLNEFQINEHHLYFKGICKDCLEKEKIKN